MCKDLFLARPYLGVGFVAFWEKVHATNEFVDMRLGVFNTGLLSPDYASVRYEVMGPGFPSWTSIGDEMVNMANRTCGQGRVVDVTVPFAFPQEGSYEVRVTVDYDGLVDECDETNNVFLRTVIVEDIPDLITLSTFINPSDLNPDLDEDITVNVTYENLGKENVNDLFDLQLSVDGVVIETQQVSGLPTNNQATITFTTPWSSNVQGGHVIEAFVDSAETINEQDESNNEATRAIVVGAAPNLFFVDFMPSDLQPNLGDEILIQSVLSNAGDVDVTSDLDLFYLENNGDTILILSLIHI